MPTEVIGELIRKACYPAPYVKHPNIGHVNKACYPAPYVKHPNIGHVNMVDKLFPYLKPELLNFEQYMSHYQAAYALICKDFDSYLAYLEEEHWNNFKNKHKMNNDRRNPKDYRQP